MPEKVCGERCCSKQRAEWGFLLLVSVRTGDVVLGHPKAGGRERLGEAAWPGVAMRQLYYFVYNLTVPYA